MKKYLYGLLVFVMIFSMSACSSKKIATFSPVDLSGKVKSGEYQKKVDNFLVVFDASSSMFDNYDSIAKFKLAKSVANNMNQTIPDLDLRAGTLLFGPEPYTMKDDSELLYGMTKYTKDGFASTLASVTSTGGVTPLAESMEEATRHLKGTEDRIAVIVITDAKNVGNRSVDAAKATKAAYGDNVCIYTILIGNDMVGRDILNKMADTCGCGFSTDYEAVSTASGMANFVERVFLEKVADSDGDGVLDPNDRCPNSPPGANVDEMGCQIKMAVKPRVDSDGDGVYDSDDKCPGTPMGLKVDMKGCPLPITQKTTIELRVEFDFDKYFVRTQYHQKLKEFADFLKAFPRLQVVLEGHTDNWGSDAYNKKLSAKRAESVKKYLEAYFDIAPSRLKTQAYGFSRPETTNATTAGRQKNRRVYATLSAK